MKHTVHLFLIFVFSLLLASEDHHLASHATTATTTTQRRHHVSTTTSSSANDKTGDALTLLAVQKPKTATKVVKRSEGTFIARQYDTQPAQAHQPYSSRPELIATATGAHSQYNDDHHLSPTTPATTTLSKARHKRSEDICSDRLCYGLPMGCLDRSPMSQRDKSRVENSGTLCSVLVTSKRFIDPYRPASRDIHFELVALPVEGRSNYAAVGFSETGRMAGLVSECLQYRDSNTHLQVIKLAHSYNIPGAYSNVPVTILGGIQNLGVSFESGYYQCRWIVESAVEFTYEDLNGTVVNRREDLGYKNYHILLASGEYNEQDNCKYFNCE